MGTNLGTFGFTLPVFVDYMKDGNNYYGFVTNNMPGKLIRLDFGNSLLNTPTAYDMGNLGGVIPDFCEGIQLVKNEGRWYVLVVGGKPAGRIVKVDFGPSLSNNTPVATNWGNIGNLSYPTDLHVFQDGPNWYGLTINAITSNITRFNFTNSFNNVPTGSDLGNIGALDYPTGIYAINNNGNWYAFVSNASAAGAPNSPASSLTRLDFGNSLLNLPTGINLGNPGNTFRSARDLTIYKSCNEIFGFAVNNSNNSDIVRLNFNNSLTATPTAISLGNTGNLSFPHSISKLFRVGNDLYSFITNVNNNTLTRLKFDGCSSSSLASSTLQSPAPITYNNPGTYNISLTVDDGLPSQTAYCKQVVVINNTHAPLQTKSFCIGDSVLLTSAKASGNLWNTGSASNAIYIKSAGTYWVQSSSGGCVNIDSFIVTAKASPVVNIGADTFLCSLDTLLLNAGNSGATYTWQNGETTQTFTVRQGGLYSVTVSMNGCVAKDSILISDLLSPIISLSGDTTICRTNTAPLMASGGSFYSWFPTSGLSDPKNPVVSASPITTTKYYLTVTNNNGCKAKDSVTVSVVPNPVVNIGVDTSLCTLDSLLLDAGNTGGTYVWQNNQNTQTFVVRQGGLYYVTVNKNGCVLKDSILISALI
ncbi:MAG: hypothetical protein M3Y85_07185, partial [Bacteroidota bacterium]|nr:hypothetical protein [Bacteroidota bacterium]